MSTLVALLITTNVVTAALAIVLLKAAHWNAYDSARVLYDVAEAAGRDPKECVFAIYKIGVALRKAWGFGR